MSCVVICVRAPPGFLAERLKADKPQLRQIAFVSALIRPIPNEAVHTGLPAAIDLAGELVEIRADLVDGTDESPQSRTHLSDRRQVKTRGAGRLWRRAFRIMELTDSPRVWAIWRMVAASCGLMRIVTMVFVAVFRCRCGVP